MSIAICPKCHAQFTPIHSVNMVSMDEAGKRQKGWCICTECNETVLPSYKPPPSQVPNVLRPVQVDLAMEACIGLARTLRQNECYPKDDDYDVPLGHMVVDLDKLRGWLRGLDRELAHQVFSDPVVLRGVFGYERWYGEICRFLS
jgi:hypothetical protein